MSVPVTVKRALATLPKLPTVRGVRPTSQFTIPMESVENVRSFAASIRAVAKSVKAAKATAYVELELPQGVEKARRYGPVRYVSVYVPFPLDGGEPGIRFRLDVGVR